MSSPTKFDVIGFLRKTGLVKSEPVNRFWRTVVRQHGPTAQSFLDCVQQRELGVSGLDPHRLKNATLPFANAIASQYDQERFKIIGEWLINQPDLIGRRVLEIGCDNGILSCLVASAYPSAKVTAIDRSPIAIERARERAAKLGLTNVEFVVTSLEEYPGNTAEDRFDVVLSVLVSHEMLGFDLLKGPSSMFHSPSLKLLHEREWSDDALLPQAVTRISSLMASDGRLISIERWGNPESALRWIRMLEQIGLRCDSDLTDYFECSDVMQKKESFPVIVARPSSGTPIMAWNVLNLFARSKFARSSKQFQFEDDVVAEMVYTGLSTRPSFVQEAIYKNGSGTMLTEIGTAGPMAYRFVRTSHGYRRLQLVSQSDLEKTIQEVQKLGAEMASYVVLTEKFAPLLGLK